MLSLSDIRKLTILFPLVIQIHFNCLYILLVQVQAGVRQATVSVSVTADDKDWSITALSSLHWLLPFTVHNFDLEWDHCYSWDLAQLNSGVPLSGPLLQFEVPASAWKSCGLETAILAKRPLQSLFLFSAGTVLASLFTESWGTFWFGIVSEPKMSNWNVTNLCDKLMGG